MALTSKGYTSSYRGSNPPGAYITVKASDFGTLPVPPASLRLGSAGNYSLLAYSGVTNTGNTTITGGNVGSFPTESITGIFQSDGGPGQIAPPYVVDNAGAQQARIDGLAAYNYYAALSFTSLGGAIDLSTANGSGGKTYTPGNYSFGAATCSDGMILNGAGLYVFKGSSTINLASGKAIVLQGGATADNVIWLVGSSLTTVATSTFVGNILAVTSITLGGGALVGRALAIGSGNGAVTIAAATVVTSPSGAVVAGVQNPLPIVPANGTADYVLVTPNAASQWKVQKSVQWARPQGIQETPGISIDGCDCITPVYPGTGVAVVADYSPAAYMTLNGYTYKATTAGTTAATFIGAAAFKTALGATTTDNGVVWTSQGKTAIIRVRFSNSSVSSASPVAQEYDFLEL